VWPDVRFVSGRGGVSSQIVDVSVTSQLTLIIEKAKMMHYVPDHYTAEQTHPFVVDVLGRLGVIDGDTI